MAKLYWTKDVRKIVEDEIAKRAALLVTDEQYDLGAAFRELRVGYKFAKEILSMMEELDRADDEMMEALKAEKEAMKNADS